jgi:hypothetical protein
VALQIVLLKLCIFLISPMRATYPAYLIVLNLIIIAKLDRLYVSFSCLCLSSLAGSDVLRRAFVFLETLSLLNKEKEITDSPTWH